MPARLAAPVTPRARRCPAAPAQMPRRLACGRFAARFQVLCGLGSFLAVLAALQFFVAGPQAARAPLNEYQVSSS
ncbi:MAG: hypothetical protein ACLP7J_21425 [Streptosporangiaceae bacterium]